MRSLFLLMNAPYLVLMLLWLAGVGLHHLPQPALRWTSEGLGDVGAARGVDCNAPTYIVA